MKIHGEKNEDEDEEGGEDDDGRKTNDEEKAMWHSFASLNKRDDNSHNGPLL